MELQQTVPRVAGKYSMREASCTSLLTLFDVTISQTKSGKLFYKMVCHPWEAPDRRTITLGIRHLEVRKPRLSVRPHALFARIMCRDARTNNLENFHPKLTRLHASLVQAPAACDALTQIIRGSKPAESPLKVVQKC